MSKPGIAVTRTDVLRAAVLRGLEAVAAEHPEPVDARQWQRAVSGRARR